MRKERNVQPLRYGIVGSRDYHDENAVREFVRSLPSQAIVISGGARGVDTWAADEAEKRGLVVYVYHADWDLHGKSAGMIRNRKIVAESDKIVAFWDGQSRGTQNTINLALGAKKLSFVFGSDGTAEPPKRDPSDPDFGLFPFAGGER